ncbi:MAG: thioredoxin family protein [Candidatus Sumerlaeaceae bacterium]|nr:thioredoxin family protein [Candidatus Sumerlaeaceae bacterium]
MKRGLGLAVILGCLLGASDVPAADIIIESRAEGKNNQWYKELAGNWVDSQVPPQTAKSSAIDLTPQGTCGSRKFAFVDPTGANRRNEAAAVSFSPVFTEAGRYYVYTTWPRAANAAPVYYTIKHAGGETTKSVQQDGWGSVSGIANANKWVLLGDFEFKAGEGQGVVLSVDQTVQPLDTKNFGQVYADAVRFTTTPLPETAIWIPGSPGTSLAAPTPSAPPLTAAVGTPSLPGLSPSAPVQLSWVDDIARGQQLASQTGRKIFVFFAAPESATSRYYDEQVFTDPVVSSILATNFVLVRFDFQRNTDMAYRLGVFRAGTINVYNSAGQPLQQFTDRLTASELAAKLRAL